MKIITFNVNGVRAAARKGLFDWLRRQEADVVCLQELKAQEAEIYHPEFQAVFFPSGYHAYFHFAQKKGYSGVAIYTRNEPTEVVRGLGWDTADTEGRHVAIKLDGLWISSLYMPSGTSGEERQTVKFDFLRRYEAYLLQIKQLPGQHIICGDFNIAHKMIDLKNWKTNQKTSGFLPEERAWMDKLFGELGFLDAFRLVNSEEEQYTFWSSRGQAWDKNVGWRIDYQVITPGLKDTVRSASIYKDQRFSDHAPLLMEYDLV